MPSEDTYRRMYDVMARRGGRYTGVDVPEFYAVVRELFTAEEAAVNNAMPKGLFTAAHLAKDLGRSEEDTSALLETMADKALCFSVRIDGRRLYAASRFVPGIFEFQFMRGTWTDKDKRIAKLIHEYKQAVDARTGPVEIKYPAHRVITVDRKVEAGTRVQTYQQVDEYIDQSDLIAVASCYCRHEAKLIDDMDDCGKPADVCMQFGHGARFVIERGLGRQVDREEAREVLRRAEEAGLVHCTMNTREIDFLCNCCACHCMILKPALQQPKPGLILSSGFQPSVDPVVCTACENCVYICPAEALTLDGEYPVVDLEQCIGCGVCASNCPADAIVMQERPDVPAPPEDKRALVQAVKAAEAG